MTKTCGLVLSAGLLALVGLLTGGDRAADAKGPEKPAAPQPGFAPEQVRFINEKIADKWKEQQLTPSPRCTDYEFIRRASLDIVGRIATPEEIRQYLNDPPATRRALLIDRLLNSEDYARNWATIWTVWLMTRTGPPTYHEQMHLWLEEQFSKQSCGWDKVVTELVTAKGKTSENGAVNFILANLGEMTPPKDVDEEGQFSMVPATSRAARLFLGIQIQCTQCHDHPFKAQRKQKDFWETVAFFRQVQRKGVPAMQRGMPVAPELTLTDNPNWNVDQKENGQIPGAVFYEKRNGALLMATPAFFLDEKTTKGATLVNGERRQRLADYIVKSDYFPKAYVNRLWAHFFGKGMNTPGAFDDFGEDNQITHPELLDYLAKEFRAYQFNPRELIRWICNSEAYSLSSVANKTNEKPEAEPFFSRMLLKTMSPEQLFESLMVATQAEAAETKEAKKKLREQWLKKLIVNFGDDEGNEVTFNGTVVQALILMNGKEINTAITNHKKGPVAAVLSKKGATPKMVMDSVFLAVLNRAPTGTEFTDISRKLKLRVGDRDPYAPWQDLEWALINSNEFILNH
jgi:hypothetical protein